MKHQAGRVATLLVCTGVMTASAWAEGTSQKTDRAFTVIEKSSLQLVFDASSAEGKGDLLVSNETEVVIQPASAEPFAMVPNSTAIAHEAECAVSSLTSSEVRRLVIKAAQDEGFDVDLALAVAEQESGYNPNALSVKGALGPMQLMPGTARDLQVDRCNPADNARGGVRYLKSLTAQFGNPVFALAAYNAGPENVTRHKGIPPFSETVHYVARVLSKYYGAPKRFQDEKQVAAATPVKKTKRISDNAKTTPASGTPDVWASGFVMHLN